MPIKNKHSILRRRRLCEFIIRTECRDRFSKSQLSVWIICCFLQISVFLWKDYSVVGDSKGLVQDVKVLVTKPYDAILISRRHRVEGKNELLQVALCSLHVHLALCSSVRTVYIRNVNKFKGYILNKGCLMSPSYSWTFFFEAYVLQYKISDEAENELCLLCQTVNR